MGIGGIGNTSVAQQTALEGGAQKVATNSTGSIKNLYGDASKTSMLSAHMNRMAGFYANVKPIIHNAIGEGH